MSAPDGGPLAQMAQVAPSESCRESQMKSDAQIPSSSRPSVGAMVAPIAKTPVAEVPVAEVPVAEVPVMETPIAEAPVDETLGAEALVAPSSTPAPMETGRAGDGQSWAEEVGLRSALGPNRGGANQNHRFPSLSGTVRGGSPPTHNSMRMWQSSPSLTTMWLVV